jgi:hypothetical protein
MFAYCNVMEYRGFVSERQHNTLASAFLSQDINPSSSTQEARLLNA